MSFEKINNNNLDKIHNRKCIMLVNFNKKELSLIKNVSNFAGIRDHIILSDKNGENIIRDILDGNISSECENGIKSKSVTIAVKGLFILTFFSPSKNAFTCVDRKSVV